MNSEILELSIEGIPIRLSIPDFSPPAKSLQKMYQTRPGYAYEAVMSALLHKILDSLEAPVYADIGTYIGFYSVYVAKLLAGRGKVLAIESNADYIEVLKQNLTLNQVEAHVIHTALSDQVETLKILGSAISAQPDADGVSMQAETLDSLCQRLNVWPQVVNMDVHGFEGKILGGMPELLKGPLQYLLLELHPNLYLEEFTPGITRMQMLDQLEAAGFNNYYIAGHRYNFADGMGRFFADGQFAYQPLTRENRGMLLFDRYNQIFVLASKMPLEALIGLSIRDPSAA